MANHANKHMHSSNKGRQMPSRNGGHPKFPHLYTYRHPSSYDASRQNELRMNESAPGQKQAEDNLDQEILINESLRIPYTYIDWGSALESALIPLHKLLAPPASPCLACGKVISDSAKGYPEICSACYVSIPWIRHIKCSICGRAAGCPDCTRETPESRHFVLNRSVVSYTPLMRDWLARFKFRGDEALGGVLARMVGDGMKRLERELSLNSNSRKTPFFDIVTYVPISRERMLERGFNQARILAIQAARGGRIPLLELLQRSRHTDKQSSKSRKQRLQDLHGIFLPSEDAEDQVKSLKGKDPRKKEVRILLVDDVYTTGSTVDACARALQQLFMTADIKAEIYSLTWARS